MMSKMITILSTILLLSWSAWASDYDLIFEEGDEAVYMHPICEVTEPDASYLVYEFLSVEKGEEQYHGLAFMHPQMTMEFALLAAYRDGEDIIYKGMESYQYKEALKNNDPLEVQLIVHRNIMGGASTMDIFDHDGNKKRTEIDCWASDEVPDRIFEYYR